MPVSMPDSRKLGPLVLVATVLLFSACSGAGGVPPSSSGASARTESSRESSAGTRYGYISDYVGNFVDEFDPSGKLVMKITSGLNGPTGLYVDASHNLWVANTNAGQVLMFPEGASTPTRTLQDTGAYPQDVVLGADGTAYVANGNDAGSSPGSIWVYPPGNDTPTRALRDPVMSHNFFITIDPKNDLFVTTYHDGLPLFIGRVDEYIHAKQGGLRHLRIKLGGVGGIVWRNGKIYVCDSFENSVTEFTDTGLRTGRVMPAGTSWDGIDVSPEGMVLGADQTLNEGLSRRFPEAKIRATYSDSLFQIPVGAAFQTDEKGSQ